MVQHGVKELLSIRSQFIGQSVQHWWGFHATTAVIHLHYQMSCEPGVLKIKTVHLSKNHAITRT